MLNANGSASKRKRPHSDDITDMLPTCSRCETGCPCCQKACERLGAIQTQLEQILRALQGPPVFGGLAAKSKEAVPIPPHFLAEYHAPSQKLREQKGPTKGGFNVVVITMNLIRFLADDTFKRSFSTGLSVADEADFKVCFLKAIKTKYMNIHDETSQLKKCMFDKVSDFDTWRMRLWEPEDGMALANQRLKHLVLSERQAGCECLSQDVQEVWDMLRATPRATALALSLYHLRVRFCEHCRTDASVSGLMALKNLVA